MQASVSSSSPSSSDYDDLLSTIRARVATVTGPLFVTDATGLFDVFLAGLPAEERQHYTCRSCRGFFDAYGGVVTIGGDGRALPVFWDPTTARGIFAPIVAALAKIVARAKVVGVFLASETTWGRPVTGAWHHIAVEPPRSLVYRASPLKTAYQASAEKREDYGMLCRGLADFTAEVLGQAVTILQAEALTRSEKFLGVAKWLADLHTARADAKGSARDNVTWLAVATAPAGFCHVRSTMIGTLLEDLAAGLPFEEVKRKFTAKMHPLQYQRPQAPPAAGNIAAAEKVIAGLRSSGSLDRRFARLSDVVTLWTPTPTTPPTNPGGVFGHLAAKGVTKPAPLNLPPVVMTWEKFARTVLPDAVSMECEVSSSGNFHAFTAASNPDAPPIIQWDREDRRNSVSWYTYHGGSLASRWGLAPGFRPVSALTLFPNMWQEGHAHHGAGVLFALEGAKDSQNNSLCLFPEHLRSDYHGIRATIEAHSKSGKLTGQQEAEVCGLTVRKGTPSTLTVRVTPKVGGPVTYRIDRWD